MNIFGAIITIALIVMTVVAPRKWAVIAIFLGVIYLTQGLSINVGINLTSIRLILLASTFRIIVRGEHRHLVFGEIDRALIFYAVCLAIIATIRVGTAAELIYQMGGLYNILISYFVFRSFVQEPGDVRGVLSALAVAMVPLALLLIRESLTTGNAFAIFGGVPEVSLIREGHVRAQGAFRSPITTGAFGATLAMFYATVIFARDRSISTFLGLAVSLTVVGCAHSSGPLLGLILGISCFALWKYRAHMQKLRWGLVISLIGLNMVMKAPVWFLIARISDVVGGGGYHRAKLIDQFVNFFGSWWLLGTSDTSDWMPYQLESGGTDLTNQFVSDGVNGGLLGLILSVILIVRCFQMIGRAGAASEKEETERWIWGVGSILTCNIAILFSVTYFDQMQVIWYFVLATIVAFTTYNSKKSSKPRHSKFEAQPTPF